MGQAHYDRRMSKKTRYTSNHVGLGFRVGETSTVQESVLNLLMDAAGVEHTELEVRQVLALPRSSVQRALKELVEQGLVVSRSVGRTRLYSLDADDPMIRHLKIARAIARARQVLSPVVDRIDLAVLFGSASRGEDTLGSDLDLLVVSEVPEAVLEELARYEWLQPVVLTPSGHMQVLAEGGTFAHALASGIKVAGRDG